LSARIANDFVPSHLQDVPNPALQIQMHSPPFLHPSVTGLKASLQTNSVGAQVVFSALLPQQTSDPPRNPALPALGSAYDMLLPCLEMCNEVDRACPPLVQFMCPIRRFNAAASYGVGYIDGPDGEQYQGLTGGSQDRWGDVWCHKI
jgi:calcium channel MID1